MHFSLSLFRARGTVERQKTSPIIAFIVAAWLLPHIVPDSENTHSSLTRVELGLVIALTLIAGLLRCVNLDDLAIEHFDEGVYASNLWFPDDGFEYPDRHLFAPPLVPSLIEWSLLIFPEQTWAPFLPALLLGTLSVPLVWLVGRNWFGAPAGVAAACLLAMSDFHIALSRSALTDVTMTFFLIAAVGLFHSALTQDRLGRSLLAGVATGWAWSAKYNGWLAVAICFSGTIAALLIAKAWLARQTNANAKPKSKGKTKSTSKRKTKQDLEFDEHEPNIVTIGQASKHLVAMLIVAGIVWYPVYDGLQAHGGYSSVSENHQQYVVGLSGWWSGLVQHESVQRHYAGWLSWIGGMLSVVCAVVTANVSRSTWNVKQTSDSSDRTSNEDNSNPSSSNDSLGQSRSTWNVELSNSRIVFVVMLAGAIVLSPLSVFVIWSITTIGATLLSICRRPNEFSNQLKEVSSNRWFGLWFSLAWLTGLLLATPMYHSYPRLLLPLLAVGCIATGAACVMLLFGGSRKPAESNSKGRWVTIVLILIVCSLRSNRVGFRCWEPRTNMATIAELAIADAESDAAKSNNQRPDVKFILYVYGEPGLFFHIPREGVPTRPIQDLSFAKPNAKPLQVPTYFLVGPHGRKSSNFQKQLREVRDHIELVQSYKYEASDFVLLDDFKPSQLSQLAPDRIALYRVRN